MTEHVQGATRAAAVLLAAGTGSRFDGTGHKLLAPLDRTSTRPAESVVARSAAQVAQAVSEGIVSHLVVVTGAADIADEIERVGAEFDISDRILIARNTEFALGQATSVHSGLARLTGLAVDAPDGVAVDVAIVGLADQPDIATATWTEIARRSTRTGATPIVVATYDGRPRNPVGLHRSVWSRLPTSGDRGARDLIRLHPDLVTPVPSLGSPTDIDTVEDLRRWQST